MKKDLVKTTSIVLCILLIQSVLIGFISTNSGNKDQSRSSLTDQSDVDPITERSGYSRADKDFLPPDGDLPTWTIGDWWEYDTFLNNSWPDSGEYIELTGTTRYTLGSIEIFSASDGESYLAYNLTVSGNAAGHALYNTTKLLVNGDRLSEELTIPAQLSGYRVLRVSDFALLRELTFLEGFVHYDAMGLKFNLTESLMDQDVVDICDFPLTPEGIHNFSTMQNRTFSLYLSEAGYYLRQFSELFPYSYEMNTSSKMSVNCPAGDFDTYRLSGFSLSPGDLSTMNLSFSPDAKNYCLQDVYRLTVTDQDNVSVVDAIMELSGYQVVDVVATIDTSTDFALPNIPVTVDGNFPGHVLEDVIVTFPFTGTYVNTTTDTSGNYYTEIMTPSLNDNTPSDQDLGSFGVCACIKDDLSVLAVKSIVIVGSDAELPVANAGPDRAVDENRIVNFDGTGSSDNIGIKNYTWSFDYNTTSILLYGKTASFTFLLPGTYEIDLTVMDYGDNSNTETWMLTVNDITPPVAVGLDRIIVDEGTLVLLDASSCYDPESGTIFNYTWTFQYNGINIILWGEYVNYKFVIPGNYSVTLNITDGSGNYVRNPFWVQVNDIMAPTADAGMDRTVPQGTEILLNGTNSTDNVGILIWMWTFRYNDTEHTLYGELTPFTFWTTGNYNVTLTVSDARGLKVTDNLWVNVSDSTPPKADAGVDQTVNEGTLVLLDAEDSLDNVEIINYTWTFHDGIARTLYGKSVDYTFNNAGTFIVTLRVRDAAGNIDAYSSDTVVIAVKDITPPKAVAGDDRDAKVDESVFFNGSGSWDNTGVTNWSWTFLYQNHVKVLYGMEADFTFEVADRYNVELRVRDAVGLFHIDSVLVTVNEGKKMEVKEGQVAKARVEDSKGNTVAVIEVSGNGTLDFKKMTREEAGEMAGPAEAGRQDMGIFLDITIEDLDWIYIEIPYDESDLPYGMEEESIKMYFWDDISNRWKEVENCHVDVDANIVWANVTHLTIFAPMATEKEDAGEEKETDSTTLILLICAASIILNIIFLTLFVSRRKSPVERGSGPEPESEKVSFIGEEVEEEPKVIESTVEEFVCPECGEEMGEDAKVCASCGVTLVEDEVKEDENEFDGSEWGELICPECWDDVSEDDEVCPHCGTGLFDDEEDEWTGEEISGEVGAYDEELDGEAIGEWKEEGSAEKMEATTEEGMKADWSGEDAEEDIGEYAEEDMSEYAEEDTEKEMITIKGEEAEEEIGGEDGEITETGEEKSVWDVEEADMYEAAKLATFEEDEEAGFDVEEGRDYGKNVLATDEDEPHADEDIEEEGNDMAERIAELQPGDVIISKSGTERTVLSVDGEVLRVITRKPRGKEKEEEVEKGMLLFRMSSIDEIRHGEERDELEREDGPQPSWDDDEEEYDGEGEGADDEEELVEREEKEWDDTESKEVVLDERKDDVEDGAEDRKGLALDAVLEEAYEDGIEEGDLEEESKEATGDLEGEITGQDQVPVKSELSEQLVMNSKKPELVDMCRKCGIRTRGLKSELQERLLNHIAEAKGEAGIERSESEDGTMDGRDEVTETVDEAGTVESKDEVTETVGDAGTVESKDEVTETVGDAEITEEEEKEEDSEENGDAESKGPYIDEDEGEYDFDITFSPYEEYED